MDLNLGEEKKKKEESILGELNNMKLRGRNKQVALKAYGYHKWVGPCLWNALVEDGYTFDF